MITKRSLVERPTAFFGALLMLAGAVAPAAIANVANAAQLASRSIQMSRSTPSATSVRYKVQFTAQAGANAVLIDFCSESPIIGQPCTAPAGFSASGATIVVGTQTTGWAMTTTASQVRVTGTAYSAGVVSFEINGITNPSATGSFYARILTYASGFGNYSSVTDVGTYVDYGGIALSTATDITISAMVMETLTFCTSKTSPGPNCASLEAPDVRIGTGEPPVLDPSRVDTDTAHTQLSTNASSGAIVNLKTVSSTTCAGLSRDGGATCQLAAIGSFAPITAGSGQFGLNVANSTGDTGVTADADYGPTSSRYGMNQTNVLSPYGDTIMSSTGPVMNADNLLTYAASPTSTTPAGVYTTTQSLIATGTF